MKQKIEQMIGMVLSLIILIVCLYGVNNVVSAITIHTTSENGISMIKQFEGFRSTAYKALSTEKYYTIGYGHYGSDVYKGMKVTEKQADQMLRNDLQKYENYVNRFLSKYNVSINQNQYDALVSFTYNLGDVWTSTSTFKLKTYLINGVSNYSASQITTAFTNWNKAGGKVQSGLTKRRKLEAQLFLTLDSNTSQDFSEPTGYQTISDGEYHIVSAVDNNKCVDVYGAFTNNHANIQLYEALDESEQVFQITYLGDGYYKIINKNSGKSIDVENSGTTSGTNVLQYDYSGGKNQQWVIKEAGDGYFYIISRCNGLYLDVNGASSANETNIQMYSGNGSSAQKWKFIAWGQSAGQAISDGDYHIVSAVDNTKTVNVTGKNTADGVNIQLWSTLDEDEQVFQITYLGDGYYKLINKNSGKSIDVENSGTTSGTNVLQFTYHDGDNQKWIIKEAEDGYFYIVSKCNGLYLDVNGASSVDGTNIQMYTGNGSSAQKWKFIAWGKSTGKTIENGDYHIVSALDSTKGLEVSKASTNSGANIQIGSNTTDTKQVFSVTYLENGYYKITNKNSGKSLDVYNNGTKSTANVIQFDYKGQDNQKWIIKDAGNGYYYIVSKCSGLYVDVANGKKADGTNVWMYVGNKSAPQKWKFVTATTTTELSNCTVTLDASSYIYDGTEKKPIVTVKNGTTTLKKDTDYTVTYVNNTDVGTATATITGKGNYSGSIQKTYKITGKTITDVMISDMEDVTYTGEPVTQEVEIADNAKILEEGVDYTVTYQNNIDVGEAKIIITGIGNYTGSVMREFDIIDIDNIDETDEEESDDEVGEKDISEAIVTLKEKYIYTGKSIQPAIILNVDEVVLEENTDYTVRYEDNIQIGTANIVVEGIGEYSGKTSFQFQIIPQKATLSSVKSSASKKVAITWKKLNNNITGYQIYRATSKNGSYKKVKTIAKASTVKWTNIGLTSKKTYYYKVRAYKTVNGKNYYGAFSAIKAVKVK